MPFALLIVGAFLLIAAVRGTADGPNGLFALIAGDFTGSPNFVFWIVAILVIGVIGYVPRAKPVSDAMLALVILVLFLSKGNPAGVGGGFFSQLTSGLNTTTTATPNATAVAAPAAASATPAMSTVTNPDGSVNPISSLGLPSLPVTNPDGSVNPILSLPSLSGLVQ